MFVRRNYGPTIAVQSVAVKHGCQQVLWLYGDQEEITEVGTMNLFIYWTNESGGEARSPDSTSWFVHPDGTSDVMVCVCACAQRKSWPRLLWTASSSQESPDSLCWTWPESG